MNYRIRRHIQIGRIYSNRSYLARDDSDPHSFSAHLFVASLHLRPLMKNITASSSFLADAIIVVVLYDMSQMAGRSRCCR